jgi:hypothetical protein
MRLDNGKPVLARANVDGRLPDAARRERLGLPVSGRVSRLDASAPWPVQATERVLLDAFRSSFPATPSARLPSA